MKRILASILIIITIFSLAACSAAKTADEESPSPSASAAAQEEASKQEEPAIGEHEAEEAAKASDSAPLTKADESKKVYWATEGKDSSDVAYHTKDCAIIKDKSPDVLPWQIINTLGMPPCEKCKP